MIIATLICFILTLTFSALSFYKAKQNQISVIETSLQEVTDELSNSIDEYFKYNFKILEYLASYEQIYSMDKEKQYEFLKDKFDKLDFEEFIIVDTKGKGYYISTNEVKDQSKDKFFEDITHNERFITEPYIELNNDLAITTVCVSIYDSGKKVGSLCGVIDLRKILKVFENEIFGKEGYSFLINEKGDYVAHSHIENVLNRRNMFEDLDNNTNNIQLLKSKIKENKSILENIVLNGKKYYTSINSLNYVNWYVVFLTSEENVLAGLNNFFIFQIGAIVFCILLVIYGLRIINNSIKNHKLAYTDSLTGINNRAAIDATFKILNNKYKSQIIIISFDLNDFKYCNDTYGHHIGDELLCVFSKILKNTLGDIGFIGRMGGDEFIAIIVDKDILDIERKLKEMKSLLYKYNESSEYILKISYGYSVRNSGDTVSLMKIYRQADNNMYMFKKKFKKV